jgi:hypothetical protein
MIRLAIPLTNERVYYRRSDGAFPHRSEPVVWLEDHGLFGHTSPHGQAIQDAAEYDGYRYRGKNSFYVVSGVFVISYQYGDIRLGPEAHLYSEPHMTRGPIIGHFWFNVDAKLTAMKFQLTWT